MIIVVVVVAACAIGKLEPLRDIKVENTPAELGFAIVRSLHVETGLHGLKVGTIISKVTFSRSCERMLFSARSLTLLPVALLPRRVAFWLL